MKLVSAERGKSIVWGVAPFPVGNLEPILADIDISSDTMGVLFRNKNNHQLFALGRALETRSIHPKVAQRMIEIFEKQKQIEGRGGR
jgi:hypothetical protein